MRKNKSTYKNKKIRNKKRRKTVKNQRQLFNVQKGGFNWNLQTILVAGLSIVSNIVANAKTCSEYTVNFQDHVLGHGAFHITTRDSKSTGAQKRFRVDEVMSVAIALHMESEGLFAPLVEACTARTKGMREYIVTSELMRVPGNQIVDKRTKQVMPGWEKSFKDFKKRVQLYESQYNVKLSDVIQFNDDGSIASVNTGNFMADGPFGIIYVVDSDLVEINKKDYQIFMDELERHVPEVDDSRGYPMNPKLTLPDQK